MYDYFGTFLQIECYIRLNWLVSYYYNVTSIYKYHNRIQQDYHIAGSMTGNALNDGGCVIPETVF